MPCYKCKGEGGTESKLCPKCNKERRGDLSKTFSLSDELEKNASTSGAFGFVQVGGLLGAVAISAYLVCYAPFGPGYGLPKSDQAYRRCISKIVAPPENPKATPADKAKAEREAAKLRAGCEKVRVACDSAPNGKVCLAALYG
jgi:hypothetical protein